MCGWVCVSSLDSVVLKESCPSGASSHTLQTHARTHARRNNILNHKIDRSVRVDFSETSCAASQHNTQHNTTQPFTKKKKTVYYSVTHQGHSAVWHHHCWLMSYLLEFSPHSVQATVGLVIFLTCAFCG